MDSIKIKARVRTLTDYDIDPGISFEGDAGETKQCFKDEVDVNQIVARAIKSGQLPIASADANGVYGDFSNSVSYQDAMNLVIKAEEQFAALPATIRDRFANDPAKFLAFVEDKNNVGELIDLGLATRRADPITSGGSPAGLSGIGSQGSREPSNGVAGGVNPPSQPSATNSGSTA